MIDRTLASLALLLALAPAARAQGTRLAVSPESRLWLDGATNLHAWQCSTSALSASIEVDASFDTAPQVARSLEKVLVRVPVESISCGHAAMDRTLRQALAAGQDPRHSYIVGTFRTVAGASDGDTVKTVGTLVVAGQRQEVTMDVRADRLPGGVVEAEGSVAILMTDFGIRPPTAMFGMLRASDRVVVKFHLVANAETLVATRTVDASVAGAP